VNIGRRGMDFPTLPLQKMQIYKQQGRELSARDLYFSRCHGILRAANRDRLDVYRLRHPTCRRNAQSKSVCHRIFHSPDHRLISDSQKSDDCRLGSTQQVDVSSSETLSISCAWPSFPHIMVARLGLVLNHFHPDTTTPPSEGRRWLRGRHLYHLDVYSYTAR